MMRNRLTCQVCGRVDQNYARELLGKSGKRGKSEYILFGS